MAKTTTALGILTTAAAGAALMYLFDPEKGDQRREKLGSAACDALSAAGSYAGDTWGTVADKVKDIAGDLQDRAGDFAADHDTAHLKDHVGKLAAYASMIGSKLSDRASSLQDNAADTARDLANRGASYLNRERHGVGTAAAISAGGIGMLALGAGLAYFLDPDHGEERRTNALNCASNTVGDIGEFAGKCGNYVRDQFSGVRSKAQDLAHNVSDRATDLVENVAGQSAPASGEHP